MKASEKNDEKVKEAKVDLDEMSKKEKKEGDDRKPYSKRSKASKMTLDMSKDGESDSEMVKELEAALASVNELKAELNEVNLLNAKLLYTNKIFKAKNLNESKKVKVLKAFDKAKSVDQAKTIFETLNEGITSSVTTSSINESIKKGSASKASGLEPKANVQPIIESNDVYNRMRKLAGLL
jgi:prolyl oligopeptidase PreP (S9A serine peptidase family)